MKAVRRPPRRLSHIRWKRRLRRVNRADAEIYAVPKCAEFCLDCLRFSPKSFSAEGAPSAEMNPAIAKRYKYKGRRTISPIGG